MRHLCRQAYLFFSIPLIAFAGKPVVFADGVVNGASFVRKGASGWGVAPRSLVSIFGRDLAATSAAAQQEPLPTQLAGTSVKFNGIPAPLLFVSPEQINAQLPGALLASVAAAGTASVVVTTAAGASEPVSVDLRYTDLALFTAAGGCGPGAILNLHRNGAVSVNSVSDSFDPASHIGISVYGTGLGPLDYFPPRIPDGVIPGMEPSRNSAALIAGYLGEPAAERPLQVEYAGPAEFVGVDQINVLSTANAGQWLEGCRVPLYLTDTGASATQVVSLSIRYGGGPCSDPAPGRIAEILWNEGSDLDAQGPTSASVSLRFFEAVRASVEVLPAPGACTSLRISPAPANCLSLLSRALDAGTVTVQGPGFGPIAVTPDPQTRQYRVELPITALAAGEYRVTGTAGADVGAFDSRLTIPGGITVGNGLQSAPPLTWTGGDPSTVVTASVTYAAPPAGPGMRVVSSSPATARQLDFCGCGPVLGGSGPAEVLISMTPAPENAETFTASGLTSGRQTWQRQYRSSRVQFQSQSLCPTTRRTVAASEIGLLFMDPNGFGWRDVGGVVQAPNSSVYSLLRPEAVKVVHGRFHIFKPTDDRTWAWFPYSDLKQFEAEEAAAGGPPVFVTATYQGKRRPVLWAWSLGLQDNRPTTPADEWERAVNVGDERFIRFWLNRYVRGVLMKRVPRVQNLWVGLDECAFKWDIYGVLDDNNQFVRGVPWDPPFPQNAAEYLSSVESFFWREGGIP
ncbi:MAG: hypothetical protein M1436_04065, partial [Acidobacteria bacterium]|nr:hypothetical protein [Acidobacteriota bacterium]